MGVQSGSVRSWTRSRSAEPLLTRARLSLRKPRLALGVLLDDPVPGLKVCARQAQQSQSSAGQPSEEKHLRRGEKLSAGGSLGFYRLWADPRGNFSVSLTSFPKKPLKERKWERQKKPMVLSGTSSLCFGPCKTTEGPDTSGLFYFPSRWVHFIYVTLLNTLACTMSCAVCQWRKWNKAELARTSWGLFQELAKPGCVFSLFNLPTVLY